jgi:hypothetical protein
MSPALIHRFTLLALLLVAAPALAQDFNRNQASGAASAHQA